MHGLDKGSEEKDVLKKAGVNGATSKYWSVVTCTCFVILWEEVENAAGDEKQQEKERGMSTTKKEEKSEKIYEELLVW